MMVIVSVLSESGIFNYMGYWAFRVTKGKVNGYLIYNFYHHYLEIINNVAISYQKSAKYIGMASTYNIMRNHWGSIGIFG